MRILCLAFVVACAPPPSQPRAHSDRIALRIDGEEARAVLAYVASPGEPAWQRIAASDGYRRLVIRERAMHRTLDDGEMRAFALSPELAARAKPLADALAKWSTVDLDAIGNRVFAYLPREAKLAATVYPVIKPKPNSFVNFDDAGAAIFVSIDPEQTAEQFDNTIAHELHHIGFSSVNDPPCVGIHAVCTARTWTGAFGEGFAMLAAAGGPDIHPHHFSKPEDRERWDRDVANFDADVRVVEALLRNILEERLDDDGARARAGELYGIQGPWYTVGWVMAVAVERCQGRATLIGAMRRPWTLLARYNEAQSRCPGPATATWSRDIVDAIMGAR